MKSAIKFLLLDLDGTLIHFDMNEFVARYLSLIKKHFSHHSWSGHVPEWILAGTDLMLTNSGPDSNQVVFLNFFSEKSGLDHEQIWNHFIRFYQSDFDQLRMITERDDSAIQFLQQALVNNFQLVLATQPIFPEIAIRKRLNWAGLSHIPFLLITDIEKMSGAKPSLRYFEQVLQLIGAKVGECMMIGNDPVADMSAAKMGIKTFHVSDDNSADSVSEADYVGDFSYLGRVLGLR